MANNMGMMTLLHQALLFLFELVLLGMKMVGAILEEMFRHVIPKEEKVLTGEVALVTGAGHGIGRELAKQLVQLGVKVSCWDINKEGVEETVKELMEMGGEALATVVDVSDREAVRSAAGLTRSKLGEVTLLFNNAGIMPCKSILDYTGKEIEKIFAVNVYSQYWTVMEFLPTMISLNKGHIVALSSIAGITGTPNLVPYCSSKFAVKGFMDALFLEIRENNPITQIKFTTIHPFFVETGLAKKPMSRFQLLIPFTKTKDAARLIISAMRRNYEYEFIPSSLCFLTSVTRIFPRAAQLAVLDFLGCASEP